MFVCMYVKLSVELMMNFNRVIPIERKTISHSLLDNCLS